MASTSPSAFSTYIRRGRERIEQICRCVTHIRLMWISRGVPKNFSRIAHGFCWSTWSIQYRGGRGAWLLTSKQPSVQNSVLKYSTHGFDQTDLMSLKLVYPLIKHILPDGLLLMLVRWKAEKIKRDLFARPLSEQLSQQTQNLILTMIICKCSITRYLARYATQSKRVQSKKKFLKYGRIETIFFF